MYVYAIAQLPYVVCVDSYVSQLKLILLESIDQQQSVLDSH